MAPNRKSATRRTAEVVRRSLKRVSSAPLALASDGTILLNLATTDGSSDPGELLERALAQGSPVFVGVVATRHEAATIKSWLGDSALEAVGSIWTGGGRARPSRRRER